MNLLTQGSRIYAATWLVPADSSGRGLFVSITTIVYSDSGYTVPSTVYGEEQGTYFIYDRYNYIQQMATQISALVSGHEGEEIDYKKIRKIFEEELQKATAPLLKTDQAEAEPLDLTPLSRNFEEGLKRIEKKIGGIKIEKPEQVDLKPILKAIAGIRIPEMPKIPDMPKLPDFGPLFKAAERMDAQGIIEAISKLKGLLSDLPALTKGIDTCQVTLAEIEEKLKDAVYLATAKGREQPTGQKPRASINRYGVVTNTHTT